jgi:hypothetical protein
VTVVDFEPGHEAATVRMNPRRQGEPFLSYLERLAVLLGHMEPDQAVRHAAGTEWSSAGEAIEQAKVEHWWERDAR